MTREIESALVHAARRGNGIHKWVNAKVPDATAIVLTDEGVYFDIPEGKQVLITALHFDIETASDDCSFSMVKCAEIAGGGDAVDISGHTHIFTGTTFDGSAAKERPFNPPILVEYEAGVAMSISIKVDANDSGTTISCGWTGIVEPLT